VIVYGDPSFDTSLHCFARALRERLAAARDEEALRTVLIHAGQLEQALHDAWEGASPLPEAARQAVGISQRLTDRAASALLKGCRPLEQAAGEIEALLDQPDRPLRVKVPEGFAFYLLFPEQYAAAARRWAADHAAGKPGPVLVVGVRSIGTSLSALVAAALRQNGWDAHRETVRPTGHPYAREAQFSLPPGPGFRRALVVDEGPGRSGSSMAAVAEALTSCGIEPDAISFFPGHAGDPGDAGSEAVRRWWSNTSRCVVPLPELRWEGRSLTGALAARAEALTGISEWSPPEDLGGGLWRRRVDEDPARWPTACAMFEAPKYRLQSPSGEAVLWKFAGLAVVAPDGATGAEVALARLRRRSEGGWTNAPLGSALGFVALPWVTGEPLTHEDAGPEVLAHVGRYLVEAALPAGEGDPKAGIARLAELLYWNTHESLGPEAAERTRRLPLPAGAPDLCYGDGRLAPHEWVRGVDRRLYKTDAAGHELDHTAVGSQSVLWDLASALIEWRLDESTAGPLLEAARQAGLTWGPAELEFYRMAYAAFRLGQCRMCAGSSGHDPEEQARLERAAADYQEQLAALLMPAAPRIW
jgi:hypothetical protein